MLVNLKEIIEKLQIEKNHYKSQVEKLQTEKKQLVNSNKNLSYKVYCLERDFQRKSLMSVYLFKKNFLRLKIIKNSNVLLYSCLIKTFKQVMSYKLHFSLNVFLLLIKQIQWE